MPNTTITPTDVISQWGSYYLDEGQNMSQLKMRPFQVFGTRDSFTNVPTDDTLLKYSDVQVGEILQPYQDAYTPKGSVTFKPIEIKLKQAKIDQAFNPNNLVNTWVGFLTNNNVDRTTWPFIKWFIEEYLLKQMFKDIETKSIFFGSEVAATPGTAGAAIEVVDGVKELLKDGITAGSITPIGVGAPPVDPKDFVKYVEEMAATVDDLYWDEVINFNMSKKLRLRYRQGRKLLYNPNYQQVSDLDAIENFDNWSVAGRQSMQGSNNIWGTPKPNAVFGTKGFSNASAFEIEKLKREVYIMTDFHFAPGFLLKDLVFTNGEDVN